MIYVLVTLVIVGLCLYLAETYVPMSPPIKTILRVVVVLLIILWLLQVFGVMDIPIPRVR
jgi:hypothetical protein